MSTELYDRGYYLGDCEGHEDFRRTAGRRLGRRLKKCLALLQPQPGERIVDIGSGRGELSLHVAALGAESLAIDSSAAALHLAREAATAWNLGATGGRLALVRARGESLPVVDGWADAGLLVDVVEHIEAEPLQRLLAEMFRLLRPGGRLVVHTSPNRHLVQFTVPVLSSIAFLWGARLPRDLRQEMTPGTGADYHPNEQSRRGLGRVLRSVGFDVEELWLEGSYPLHRIFGDSAIKRFLLPHFRRRLWLKELFASQIFACARKPAGAIAAQSTRAAEAEAPSQAPSRLETD